MSEASYHKGLSIEPDMFSQSLRIEGQLVDIEKKGNLFAYKENRKIRDKALDQLAIKIIKSWKKFQDERNKIRNDHLQNLNDAIEHGIERWNQWRKENPEIRPLLYNANLIGKHLSSKKVPIDFSNANLIEAKLMGAYLEGANFHEANLGHANLSRAHLTGAHFCRTDLYKTILSGAKMHHANLQGTQMAMTNLRGAKLTECKIYGISAWDLEMEGATQQDFKIFYKEKNKNGKWEENHIEVDDLRVAQFIYLLLHNKNIHYIFDTLTSKSVLILGRFTKKRKKVLDDIRKELRKYKYVPMLFDFENTKSQSLLETVMTLAGMCRFIIADVTSATMVREELRSIVEKYPSKPILPILLSTEKEYKSLTEMRIDFKNILDTFSYKNNKNVILNLKKCIITPAEYWLKKRHPQISR